MDKSGANAFVFAKANGILGKSFVNERAQQLFGQKSLSDLWTLIFQTQPPLVPEVMLSQQIEENAFSAFVDQYISFLNQYDKPDPVLIDQLFLFEAENLKQIGSALCNGETSLPKLFDLGNYSVLNYKAWPDIKKITKGTVFSWYNHVPGIHEQRELDFKIDIQVCRHLWASITKEKGEASQALRELYLQEFIIKNVVWVLRLRLYYNMKAEDIIEHLIYVTDKAGRTDPVVSAALKVLDWPLDEASCWMGWKYASLVNPYVPGQVWQVDPVWIEKRCRVEINRKARKLFHQFPSDSCFLIGWYKMKEFELNCIRTAVESVRLNVNADEAMNAVGLSGGENG